METNEEYFTVFIDGELWTDVIDDINSDASWADGGIIFLNIDSVYDFIANLRRYDDWKNSKFEIKRVKYE